MMLLVNNLHPSCTTASLRNLFDPFGEVLWCRLIVDTNEHSTAFGYVEMGSQEEAEAAVRALDRTSAFTRCIEVAFSRDLIQRRDH